MDLCKIHKFLYEKLLYVYLRLTKEEKEKIFDELRKKRRNINWNKKSIKIFIETFRELNLADSNIINKLIVKFSMTLNQANKYLK